MPLGGFFPGEVCRIWKCKTAADEVQPEKLREKREAADVPYRILAEENPEP